MPAHQNTLKLHILSDLHLSRGGMLVPDTDADVVILAGDIARPEAAIAWARTFHQPVLYVPGNHEFYGNSLAATVQQLRTHALGSNIHILDNDVLILDGVRFLGSTLWGDFNLYGTGVERDTAIEQAVGFIHDFSRIQSDLNPGSPFSPDEFEALFRTNRQWLRQRLDQSFDGPTVVITHHAPSLSSVHPRFEGSPINTCFVSNSEDLLGVDKACLWIHGHTHDSFDYQINGTRVVCNPRGYMKDGVPENPAFKPDFVVPVSWAQATV
ncbi:MAG: metallophosphoesterase family protein [Burkholderiaceae bacterium]|nr:metallophosphoesterase family protein [Burkholderiaceae bacterium]